ncbi:MAG TPA: methyltransferase, partial [Gammaproteobacteria bacterium]|nr:methyltransferase [Gammaproteobacteria bacterium]
SLVWFFLGLALMLAGCALRQWAMSALRRCAIEATAAKPCEWAAAGPYRRLRHPACAGALLLWAGLGLALTNGASLLTLALTAVLAYGLRMRAEEAARSAAFGESYRSYCLHTPRLVPRILRKTR